MRASAQGPPCRHIGQQPVRVGRFTVFAGGTMYPGLTTRFADADVLVPLVEKSPVPLAPNVLHIPMKDFGGVPADWERVLNGRVIPLLERRQRLLAFCAGSHGRTGTFLASLIAILEPDSDPIEAVRQRHCRKAVETLEQATAIYALQGEDLPARYFREFDPPAQRGVIAL